MPWWVTALWIFIGVSIVAWELYHHGAELLGEELYDAIKNRKRHSVLGERDKGGSAGDYLHLGRKLLHRLRAGDADNLPGDDELLRRLLNPVVVQRRGRGADAVEREAPRRLQFSVRSGGRRPANHPTRAAH